MEEVLLYDLALLERGAWSSKPPIFEDASEFVVSLQASTRRSVVDEGVASFATS